MQTISDPFRRARSFFSVPEELLLSASVLFLPVLYMTAALALLPGIGKGIELGRWVLPTGLLLWGVTVAALHCHEGAKKVAITLLLFLAVFALAMWATSLTLDRGYDSRYYHAIPIVALLDGSNPFLEPQNWVTFPELPTKINYPIAHWLLSSSLILWTGSFEASFALTVVAAFASFLCVRRFLATLPRLSRRWRNVVLFLLVANPITTWCFVTHHTDGLFVSTLLSVFMLMLCFVSDEGSQTEDKRRRLQITFCIAALLVLLVNVKFTGLVFGGVLGLTALAYGARRGVSRKLLLRLAGVGSGAAILGVVLFGFYPYATNVAQGKNPFYPAIMFDEQGKKTSTLTHFFDPNFYNKTYYEKWWISLFSKNGEGGWTDPAPLPPFSSFSMPSFQHGFGSFFSGALLLCLTLVFFVRHRGAWIVLAGVMASVLSTGASFHFRLSPQNWWLPILFLAFLFAEKTKTKPLPKAAKITAAVIVACLVFVAVVRFGLATGESLYAKNLVKKVEKQGGWFVAYDKGLGEELPSDARQLFRYYESGLTGVALPLLKECPETAEQRRLTFGLILCRP